MITNRSDRARSHVIAREKRVVLSYPARFDSLQHIAGTVSHIHFREAFYLPYCHNNRISIRLSKWIMCNRAELTLKLGLTEYYTRRENVLIQKLLKKSKKLTILAERYRNQCLPKVLTSQLCFLKDLQKVTIRMEARHPSYGDCQVAQLILLLLQRISHYDSYMSLNLEDGFEAFETDILIQLIKAPNPRVIAQLALSLEEQQFSTNYSNLNHQLEQLIPNVPTLQCFRLRLTKKMSVKVITELSRRLSQLRNLKKLSIKCIQIGSSFEVLLDQLIKGLKMHSFERLTLSINCDVGPELSQTHSTLKDKSTSNC